MVCHSCSPSNDEAFVAESQRESRIPLDPPSPTSTAWYDPASTKHDFGLVLAGSDVSQSHTFRVVNVSKRPVRVRGVANRKPCCGDVAAVPATVVEPGQALEVPVVLKLGLGSGNVVHVAAIEAEDDDDGVNLYTTATAHARATIDEVDPRPGALEPGQSRRVEYLIQSFGVQADPPQPLDDKSIRSELPTEWVDPAPTEAGREDQLLVFRRTLAVILPALREPSRRMTTLEVRNGYGAVIGRRSIIWEVASALTASPAGLMFGDEAQASRRLKVIARSRDKRPFRILEATSNVEGLVIDLDGDSKPSHTIAARLAASGHPETRTGEVVLRTDHPNQPVVKLAVYVAGSGNGAASSETSRSSP